MTRLRISKERSGYNFETYTFKKNTIWGERKITLIAAVVYMDNTTFLVETKDKLQEILRLADEFSSITELRINPKKLNFMCIEKGKKIRTKNTKEKEKIKYKDELIEETNESVRILGAWYSLRNNRRTKIEKIKQAVRKILEVIRFSKMTDKEIIYTINAVLFPRIEYLTIDFWPSQNEIDQIGRQIRQTMRRKLNYANTAPNIIFYLKELYNVFDLEERIVKQQMKLFFERLNSTGLVGEITWNRLQQIQNKKWLQKYIFEPQERTNEMENITFMEHRPLKKVRESTKSVIE